MALSRVGELRNAMVAGVWSNSNYDDEKNSRQGFLNRIDEFYDHAVSTIYDDENRHLEEIDMDDPFFAAMKRPAQVQEMLVTSDSLGELSERQSRN
jgi:hypothetical protein